MSQVDWTRPALADLAEIDDRYRLLNADYADRVGMQAIAAGRFLAAYPGAGPLIDDGIRKWRVPRTRYVLIYRVIGHGVQVLRVRHERENWRPRT